MNDKKSLVTHGEYGKDEDSTQALIKKHEIVETEIEGHTEKLEALMKESERLISRKHFDSSTIGKRQVRSKKCMMPKVIVLLLKCTWLA